MTRECAEHALIKLTHSTNTAIYLTALNECVYDVIPQTASQNKQEYFLLCSFLLYWFN